MTRIVFITAFTLLLCGTAVCADQTGAAQMAPQQANDDIELLRKQIEAMKRSHDKEIEDLHRKIEALSRSQSQAAKETPEDLSAVVSELQSDEEPRYALDLPNAIQSLNPDLSVIMDTYYQYDDTKEGIEHVLNEISGFGHSHGGDHDHDHGGIEEGFNLRHLELRFSGEVDPYFKGWATVAVAEDGAEMEEAVIQTTCLPAGLQFQAGKFFSGFGRINSQHSHEWDFVDQPLIYRLALGSHGLNEKGAQLTWLAPTPFYLKAGVEAFQGENEQMFNHVGGDHLSKKDGPRLGVGWVKLAPNLSGPHGLQLGLFGGYGNHEEAHDGNEDGDEDHWLQGSSTFYGADAVYKYDSPKPHGQGDFVVQGEYMWRKKDIEVKEHDLMPAFVGENKVEEQDGFYAQATYGFLPRWRGGLRWDQVGLTNSIELPDGSSDHYDASHRASAIVDFTPTEFSRLRLQVGRGEYETEDGGIDSWEVLMQLMVSLGTHGAHKF